MKKLLLLAIIAMNLNTINAQWVQTNNTPGLGAVNKLVYALNLFAATENGIYFYNDNNNIWYPINTGITNTQIRGFSKDINNSLYAGSHGGGVYYSNNLGGAWYERNTGLTNLYIRTMLCNDIYAFAGTGTGVFRSTNSGNNWVAVNTGLFNTNIYSLGSHNSDIYAGTADGIYKSTDYGDNWLQCSGLWGYVESFESNGAYLFAGTNDAGVYRSSNNGANWVAHGLNAYGTYVSDIAVHNSIVYLATSIGVFLSTDNGVNWVEKNEGLTNTSLFSVKVTPDGNYIYVGTYGDGVFKRSVTEILTSIDENSNVASFMLFPNPNNGKFQLTNISNDFGENCKLEIFTSIGDKVYEQSDFYTQEQNNIDISNLSKGMYFVKITNRTNTFTERIVVQ